VTVNTRKPILHGRDHLPGGADPIPAFASGAPAYTRPGVPVHDAYYNPGGLVAWWRLGETGPWPSGAAGSGPGEGITKKTAICADSGPSNHPMDANNYKAGGTCWVPTGDPGIPTMQITGALEGGNANDGGIQFNISRYDSSGYGNNCALQANITGGAGLGEPGSGGAVGDGHTVSAWLAFIPSQGGDILGPLQFRPFMGTMAVSGGNAQGWKVEFDPRAGYLRFSTAVWQRQTAFGFAPGVWFHFAKVFQKVTSTTYRRALYINLNPVVDETGDLATMSPATNWTPLNIGGCWDDDLRFGHSRGKVDEVAIWTKALTLQQLKDVYNGRVLNVGDEWGTDAIDPSADLPVNSIGPTQIMDGSIGTGELADGSVTSAKIQDKTIATGDLADGAVTSAKILDGTIAGADIANGTIPASKIVGYPNDVSKVLRGDGTWA
jgi:hypothetical protein